MAGTKRVRAGGAAFRYGPAQGERELAAFVEIASACFNVSEDDARGWLERGGLENLRLLREGGTVCAGLLLLPMGQWFGGRAVPMTGVAGVGVPAEQRGRGAALRLMRAALSELRAQGVALSTLYPATTALYRAAGYEVAGGRYAIDLKIGALRASSRDRALVVRRGGPSDEPEIQRVAADAARRSAGQLERNAFIWQRVRTPRGRIARDFVIEGATGLEGYAFLSQRAVAAVGEGHQYEIVATDTAAITPAATRRLLALLADHAGIASRAVLYGAAAHPVLTLLPERHYTVALVDPWMLRIVHLRAALERRGWPAGLQAELLLDVTDDVLPENAGRWRLRVSRGAARVEAVARAARAAGGARGARGARGAGGDAIALDVRALAPLFSGHLSPGQLEAAGLIAGPPAQLDLAGALFAGPAPAMTDMF